MVFHAVEGLVYHACSANVNELTLLSTCAQPNLGKACERSLWAKNDLKYVECSK